MTQGWAYKELEFLVDAIRTKAWESGDLWKPESSKLKADLKVEPVEFPAFVNNPGEDLRCYKILGRQAALDLFDFYGDRTKPKDEIERVLSSEVLRGTNKKDTRREHDAMQE